MTRNKAVFLDVDGVIRHNDRSKSGGNFYTLTYDEVDWIDGVVEAHRILHKAGYDIFWVTMQNCIVEGLIARENVDITLSRMCDYIADAIGEPVVKKYVICVSNETELAKILVKQFHVCKIAVDHDIDLSQSCGIGDARSDVFAFKYAGIGTVIHIDLPDTTVINDHEVKDADGVAGSLIDAIDLLPTLSDLIPALSNGLFINVVEKLWGIEYWLMNDKDANKCVKLLYLKKGVCSSTHSHKEKKEIFTVLRGKVALTYDDYARIYKVGDSLSIVPLCLHSFQSMSDEALLLEKSTYHDDSDTYRVKNSHLVGK